MDNQTMNQKLLKPALKTVCNFLSSDSNQVIARILKNEALAQFHKILQTDTFKAKELRKEVLWGLSNIAGQNEKFAYILSLDGIFKTVIQFLESPDIDLRKEAIIIVGNVLTTMPIDKIKPLLDKNKKLLSIFMKGMEFDISNHSKIVHNIFDVIEHLCNLDK